MPAYMLDSNAISEMMRNPQGSVALTFRSKELDPAVRLCTSIISACELKYGAAKKRSAPLPQRVDRMLASIEIALFAPDADAEYATLRADLERKGQLIGPNDMLIAAHALALNAILVTDNIREFKRVKGLRIENWLRP
jgi:tRNA(fMet)-specific endonuclease VapC